MKSKSTSLKNALEKLEQELLRQRKSSVTISNYKSQLRVFGNYLFEDTEIANVSEDEIKEYLKRPENQTKNQVLYALKFYYNEVLKKEYDFSSHSISPSKNTNPALFTKNDFKLFLKKPNSQFRLLFAFVYHFELKRNEVLAIKKKDITKNGDNISVYLKERKKHYPLPNSLQIELSNYLSSKNPKTWLFERARTERPLDGSAVSRKFKAILHEAGIYKKLTLESLKKSHDEHAKQAGITLIDEALGKELVKKQQVFINLKRLIDLKEIQNNDFDLEKLIRFCEQLNGAYANEWYLTTSMLQRAILDHVPPIFGFDTFTKVANNYKGDRTFKLFAKRLDDTSRKIADKYLHSPICKAEVFPNPTQIDFKQEFDYLLTEIVRILS